MRNVRVGVGILLLWMVPALAWSQGALGGEFQVNTYTTSYQGRPSIGVAPDGSFVVVWRSVGSPGDDDDSDSIQGQLYNADGTPSGSQFQVNDYTTSDARFPSVAVNADGDFVVVWQSNGSFGDDPGYSYGYGGSTSIQARLFDNTGTPAGSQFQVNSWTTGDQDEPQVAMDATGNFVVVWYSSTGPGTDTGGSGLGILARRFDNTGTAMAPDFQVNTWTTYNQRDQDVAMDPSGNFVVVWGSNGGPGTDPGNSYVPPYGYIGSGYSVQAQRYDNNGDPVGGQFQVNTYTTNDQRVPTVAMGYDGSFLVAWRSTGSAGTDLDGTSIQAQGYDGDGSTVGSESQVNTYTTSNQEDATVAIDHDGNFVLAWESLVSPGTDSSGRSILGRVFLPGGSPKGPEVQINTATTNNQVNPEAGAHPDGGFVVAWQSDVSGGTDGDNDSIQAQRYQVATGVYVLDNFGGVHLGGDAPAMAPSTPYFGFDVAEDIELASTGFYVLDAFGGVHAGGGASPMAPSTPYFGFDAAEDIELALTGFYVLDAFGGVHAGGGASAMAPSTPYFGFDVAEDLELATTGFYVLDAFGGLHAGGGASAPSPGSTYFGFDIARDLEVSGAGIYVLDGWGGVHAGDGAAVRTPASTYFGFDIAQSLELAGPGHYVLDGWGGLHPGAGAVPVSPSPAYFGFDVAADVELR